MPFASSMTVATWPWGDRLIRPLGKTARKRAFSIVRRKKAMSKLGLHGRLVFVLVDERDKGRALVVVDIRSKEPIVEWVLAPGTKGHLARTSTAEQLIWYFDTMLQIQLSFGAAWSLGVPLLEEEEGPDTNPLLASMVPRIPLDHILFPAYRTVSLRIDGFPNVSREGTPEVTHNGMKTKLRPRQPAGTPMIMYRPYIQVVSVRKIDAPPEGPYAASYDTPSRFAPTIREAMMKEGLLINEADFDTWMETQGEGGAGDSTIELEAYHLVSTIPPPLWTTDRIVGTEFVDQ